MKLFIQRWVITTVAVMVAAQIVRGIEYANVAALVIASLLLGIFNAVLRPLLLVLSLPLVLFSLGLFILVINALLLYFVGFIVKDFHVSSFWAAFWGALVISLISILGNSLFGENRAQVKVVRRSRRPPGDDGHGPVIDV